MTFSLVLKWILLSFLYTSTSCCPKSTLVMAVLLKSTPVFALAASWTPPGSIVLEPQTHFILSSSIVTPNSSLPLLREHLLTVCTSAVQYTKAGDLSAHIERQSFYTHKFPVPFPSPEISYSCRPSSTCYSSVYIWHSNVLFLFASGEQT